MHKQQVSFSRTNTHWTVTCVHCHESKPDALLPVDTIPWMLWCIEHPCMLPPNPHYSDRDRRLIRSWAGLT